MSLKARIFFTTSILSLTVWKYLNVMSPQCKGLDAWSLLGSRLRTSISIIWIMSGSRLLVIAQYYIGKNWSHTLLSSDSTTLLFSISPPACPFSLQEHFLIPCHCSYPSDSSSLCQPAHRCCFFPTSPGIAHLLDIYQKKASQLLLLFPCWWLYSLCCYSPTTVSFLKNAVNIVMSCQLKTSTK